MNLKITINIGVLFILRFNIESTLGRCPGRYTRTYLKSYCFFPLIALVCELQ